MRNYLITCAALACAIVLMPATKSFAQPAAKPLPEGLNHVPVDAMGFIHIRISDFPKSEVGAALLTEIQREGKKGFNDLEKMFGISVSEIESVTLLILAPNMRAIMMGPGDWRRYPPLDGMRFPKSDFDRWTLISDPVDDFGGPPNPLAIITAKKPLDQKKILRTIHAEIRRDIPPHNPRTGPLGSASIVFLSERSMLIGEPRDLGRFSELAGRKTPPKTKPLESALAVATEPHLITAGGHVLADLRAFWLSEMRFAALALAPL